MLIKYQQRLKRIEFQNKEYEPQWSKMEVKWERNLKFYLILPIADRIKRFFTHRGGGGYFHLSGGVYGSLLVPKPMGSVV